ncbi:uncharacterized protein BO66DRAFT_97930 [Aspergillus aculeatinus CBS 121060]|uniref:Uncharacterized protein n=1 Tax=Aspergillus aculeatinus CBS 121060 TaxID=1448322 RepID=A0ACD1H752_9EURO|nr:hypothetical protein BO66DRAFT_97930 [Aspergillus aculeatinus CBS 121060]RAH69574.1 hypothetical protein BO66DRAFT_97930 [Aspergillus aculeatinus CBS 121060]
MQVKQGYLNQVDSKNHTTRLYTMSTLPTSLSSPDDQPPPIPKTNPNREKKLHQSNTNTNAVNAPNVQNPSTHPPPLPYHPHPISPPSHNPRKHPHFPGLALPAASPAAPATAPPPPPSAVAPAPAGAEESNNANEASNSSNRRAISSTTPPNRVSIASYRITTNPLCLPVSVQQIEPLAVVGVVGAVEPEGA